MMTKKIKYEILVFMYANQLSVLKNIFWEFDIALLDITKHSVFIIERTLEKGREEHVSSLFKIYSKHQIQSVLESSNNLSFKTKNFWSLFFKYALT